MRRWQVLVLIGAAAAAAWAVVAHSPGSRTFTQDNGGSLTTPTPPPRSGTLLFVGDIMLSRSVGEAMVARNDWAWPFKLSAQATAAADIAFGNLETTISDRGRQLGCGYCFRADPRAVGGLRAAGFDVLSVANNHIWDYGPDAFADTLRHLSAADIAPVGAGRAPILRTVAGTRVAYLAYTDLLPASACAGGVNCYDPVRMRDDIASASAAADVVVVSFHTGTEYQPPDDRQRRIYRAAVDAGADLIIGHHPHVVQGTERYHGGFIAYSLGNFVFDQTFSEATMTGMLLTATVSEGRITGIASSSVGISRVYQPAVRGQEAPPEVPAR